MKITNNCSPQFGNVLMTKKAVVYMNTTFNAEQIKKANNIIKDQAGKTPDIFLHLGSFQKANSNNTISYLRASVGNHVFKEGFFTSAFKVLKSSADYVNSLANKAKK